MTEETKEFLVKHQDDIKTKQDLFDFIVERLIVQGKKSLNTHPCEVNCAYRGDNNTRCAAGMVIKDEYYLKSIEGKSVAQDEVFELVEKSLPNVELADTDLRIILQDLQDIHDRDAIIHDGEKNTFNYELDFNLFKQYAENNGLLYKF